MVVLFIGSVLSFAPPRSYISIIVNKDNPIGKLTDSEVKLYYLRKLKTRWPDINKNIKPANRKSKCAEQDIFYSKVLGMTADEVDKYFAQKEKESAQKPPDKFETDADILKFVSTEIGAIGFVNAKSTLSDDNTTNIKTLNTISN